MKTEIDVSIYLSCRRGFLHCPVKYNLFRTSFSIGFIQVPKKIKFTIRTCSNISGVCDHVSASTVQWQQPLGGQGPVNHRTAWLNIILQRVNTYFKPTPVSVNDCVNCEEKKMEKYGQ